MDEKIKKADSSDAAVLWYFVKQRIFHCWGKYHRQRNAKKLLQIVIKTLKKLGPRHNNGRTKVQAYLRKI